MVSNNKWNADNIPDQSGRVAIVTGANSGIGYETARVLAHKDADVVMACRSLDKAQAAADQIRAENPRGSVEVVQLDLADFASIRSFVEVFLTKYSRLDLLINNAGVMALPKRWKTKDGFEMQFGTNHLGHFMLTGLLINTLVKTPGARVVMVSSAGHLVSEINFENLNSEQSYNPMEAYGQSKLANLLFAYELQRRFEAAGVDAIAVGAHPGWTDTNLPKHLDFVSAVTPVLGQSPAMGALPTLYGATAEDVQGGDYFGPRGLFGLGGTPKKARSSRRSHDREAARRLWEVSEQMTGVSINL
jgi:NAD(P)-dependent dehydrogenase (short-subunit alcohol dehydrogenase family)